MRVLSIGISLGVPVEPDVRHITVSSSDAHCLMNEHTCATYCVSFSSLMAKSISSLRQKSSASPSYLFPVCLKPDVFPAVSVFLLGGGQRFQFFHFGYDNMFVRQRIRPCFLSSPRHLMVLSIVTPAYSARSLRYIGPAMVRPSG